MVSEIVIVTVGEVEPAVLVHPKALTGTVNVLMTSAFDPASNKGHVTNPWQNRLKRASHGLLDATSTTAWYAFADPAVLAAIELCFLEGEEEPVITEDEAFKSDKRSWKVRHWVAAKAVEYRAAYKNAGA